MPLEIYFTPLWEPPVAGFLWSFKLSELSTLSLQESLSWSSVFLLLLGLIAAAVPAVILCSSKPPLPSSTVLGTTLCPVAISLLCILEKLLIFQSVQLFSWFKTG